MATVVAETAAAAPPADQCSLFPDTLPVPSPYDVANEAETAVKARIAQDSRDALREARGIRRLETDGLNTLKVRLGANRLSGLREHINNSNKDLREHRDGSGAVGSPPLDPLSLTISPKSTPGAEGHVPFWSMDGGLEQPEARAAAAHVRHDSEQSSGWGSEKSSPVKGAIHSPVSTPSTAGSRARAASSSSSSSSSSGSSDSSCSSGSDFASLIGGGEDAMRDIADCLESVLLPETAKGSSNALPSMDLTPLPDAAIALGLEVSEDDDIVPLQSLPVTSPPECHNPALNMRFGVSEDTGVRDSMEDRCIALVDYVPTLETLRRRRAGDSAVGLPPLSPQAFFGVYDGHNGSGCSTMLAAKLHVALGKEPTFIDDPADAIVSAFLAVDRSFLRREAAADAAAQAEVEAAAAAKRPCPADFRFSGATALVCVLRREAVGEGGGLLDIDPWDDLGLIEGVSTPRTTTLPSVVRLYIGYVGDCRAVLSHGGVGIALTHDHTPISRPDEVARILAAGGWVSNNRVQGVLAVSRAFGDAEHKAPLAAAFWDVAFTGDPLIVEPDIRVHDISPHDEFVIIASDGLWDVLTSQAAVNVVRRRLHVGSGGHGDVQRASEELVAKALALHSVDNITVTIVALNQ